MTKKILFWLFLGFCLGSQVNAATAKVLLERAFERHGGVALGEIYAYQDEVTFTNLGADGAPLGKFTFRSSVDFDKRRVRFEALRKNQLFLVQQLTSQAAQLWTPEAGITPLTVANGVEDLKRSLVQGIFNLREDVAGFEHIKAEGQQTWADVTGQVAEVVKTGFTTTLLLAEDGTVLGERYTNPSAGEATVLYRAYKTVADVVLPTEADIYVPGQAAPVARQTTRSIGVNQDLSLAFTPLLYLKTADFKITPQALAWVRKHAVPFTTVEPGNGFADLTPLKKSIGTTRIVALGEQTHGTHEFFKMKHRLLEFLVSEMGYSIFSIEANMPEAYRLNEYVLTGKGNPAALLKGMYFWTWDTQEVLDMIKWMRAYNASGRGPVQFTGFDMQFPQVAAEDVQSFLEKTDPNYWREIRDLYAKVGRLDLSSNDTAETRKQLEKPLAEVVTHFETNASRYRAEVPAKEVAWAVQNARVVMQAVRVISGSGTYRDQAMAENIVWILEQNPEAKMVVWAHNGHVEQREGWMGNYLSKRYGKDYLAVGFSMDQGSYTAYNQAQGALIANPAGAAPERTVDGFLNDVKLPRFVLDVRQAGKSPAKSWLAESRLFRSIGAVSVTDTDAFTPTTVSKGFDLLVFIAKTTPSVLLH